MLRYWMLERTLHEQDIKDGGDELRGRRLLVNALGALTMILTAIAVF